MGLFSSRPEEPENWGGLPAEPYNPAQDAVRLGSEGQMDLTAVGGDILGESTESVSISFDMPEAPSDPEAETDPGAESAVDSSAEDSSPTEQ